MRFRLRVFVFSSLWTLGLTSFVPAHGQDQPRFRSGVEVTSIDVTVVDESGRPVADLGPADFTVRVDGAPRRVISAEWIPRAPAGTSGGASATPSPAAYTSNEIPGSARLI